MTDTDENMVKSYGKAIAKAQVLDALVNVALENMILSSTDKMALPIMRDAGASVILLIKAFFPEEYDFKEAQLKRERDEVEEKKREEIREFLSKRVNTRKEREGAESGEENL